MLFASVNLNVFAADEISTFGITMSGFKGGGKESDVTFSLSGDLITKADDECSIAQILTFLWRAAGKGLI